MDSVKELLGLVARIEAAFEGVDAIKVTIRSRMKDYASVLEALQGSAPAVFKYELERLQDLFIEIEDLHAKHTADREDGRPAKIAKRVNRGTQHKSIGEDLDAIDKDVVRQFIAISAKSSINAEGLNTALAQLRPPPLPDMAAIPSGALGLPHGYVGRAAVQAVADGLTNREEPRTPYTVVGMGGAGKSVLISAVVRKSIVREYFRGGIFWMRVGRGAKNRLLPLLQGLAREMDAAPTDTPHGVRHVLDNLEQVQQHLRAVASTASYPLLVVLDDVWEREVVDALLLLGLKVLVTTRDRSVVGVPTGYLELGDMTEEEALELLLRTSKTVGQPGDGVRTQMKKVVALCGRLPLVLAIAGSMPVVQGKGLAAGVWRKLIDEFENVATKMEASDEDSNSLNVILETSFSALTLTKKREFKKTAVLAPAAVASIEMLQNLWETEDIRGTRDEAEGLVAKCLLQDVGGGGYRVHDLVLNFVKIKIKADVKMVEKITALQAHFLGRLDVLKSYENPEHGAGNQGLFVLDSLWRSVEKLSGDSKLEVASYSASLGALESCEATTDVACSYSSVAFLFNIQGKYKQADPLYVRVLEILGATVGEEHPDYASTLNNLAWLLRVQGKYAEAQPLYEQSQTIRERVLGPGHPDVAQSLNNRACLLREQGKYADAGRLYLRATEIGEEVHGRDHPLVAITLSNRAGLLQAQGKFEEADAFYQRALAIDESKYGPDHPEVAADLNNRASLLESQGKYEEADALYHRAQAILAATVGEEHPNYVTTLNNRAVLLQNQAEHSEEQPSLERAPVVSEVALGMDDSGKAIQEKVAKKGKGRWTAEEHKGFVRGLEQHGQNWEVIAERFVPTRTTLQIRTHSQKYYQDARKGRTFPEEPYETEQRGTGAQVDAAAARATDAEPPCSEEYPPWRQQQSRTAATATALPPPTIASVKPPSPPLS
eukprot:g15421.t2